MNQQELLPMYGIWHRPLWQTTGFFVVSGVIVGLLLGFVVWYIIKRYRSLRYNVVPAWQTALAELAKLEQELLSVQGILGKTFYFRLTWIFKRYLHERYSFEVYGKTDEELLIYLEGAGLATDLVHDLRVIFEGSLDVKFANQEALIERLKRDVAMSREFVYKTTPQEQAGK